MCKPTALLRILIGNQQQIQLHSDHYYRILTIKNDCIIYQINEQQQFHQYDEYMVHYFQQHWLLDYIMIAFRFRHEIHKKQSACECIQLHIIQKKKILFLFEIHEQRINHLYYIILIHYLFHNGEHDIIQQQIFCWIGGQM